MKKFFLKAKYFVKRNIYPITVSLCTVLMIAIIAVSAYTSISSSNRDIASPDNVIVTDKPVTGEDSDEEKNNDEDKKDEDNNEKTVTSPDPIIFGLPFENAVVSKEYAENTLLYDATTKIWCTHQGLDFACSDGQKILAIFDGTVSKIENSMMNGTVVYIKITDDLVVVYKGLSSSVLVKEGDIVKKGQEIGTATSMLLEKADGVHLHLELLQKDKLVDPTEYFSFSK